MKGSGVLLEAFAQHQQRYADSCLTIVGDGSLRGSLEKQVESLGLGKQVRSLGALSNTAVPALFN